MAYRAHLHQNSESRVTTALRSSRQSLEATGLHVPQADDFVAFISFASAMRNEMILAFGPHSADQMSLHLDYLATKASGTVAELVAGRLGNLEDQVMIDGILNITTELLNFKRVLNVISGQNEKALPVKVFEMIVRAETDLQGWCSREKAQTLATYILREKPKTCVEIGIFGGRSLIPCAAALKHNGDGAIYGIEGWQADIAVKHPTNDANDNWWRGIDFTALKRNFLTFICLHELLDQVRIVEMASVRAHSCFDSIDFLHIDGSHSPFSAAQDVILYAAKVRSGGIVVCDDINWTEMEIPYKLVQTMCTLLETIPDSNTGAPACAVLRKN